MGRQITDDLRIALAQLNPVLGDLAGNADKARQARAAAAADDADLILFSELFITGYPPEDLILKPAFVDAARQVIEDLASDTGDGGPAILIGTPWKDGDVTYNAVALLDEGQVKDVRFKAELPNYGVFDEKRVFATGPMPGPVNFRGVRIGVPICEDIWIEDVVECLEETGAELLLVPNGSPYSSNKWDVRMNQAVARVAESGLAMAYVNQIGGQDELVFDGASFVLNGDSSLALQMPAWEEGVRTSVWQRRDGRWTCEQGERSLMEEGDSADYLACVQGLRDYVNKNGFPGVVLGPLGWHRTQRSARPWPSTHSERTGSNCIMLPYRFTSNESFSDAGRLRRGARRAL